MRITMAAGVLAFGLAMAGSALGQSPAPARGAHAKPSLEGVWRINFILPMEAPPGTPQLVVSEKDAKVIAAAVGKALSEQFAAGLDPELPSLVPQSDGLPIVRGQRRARVVVLPVDGKLPYTAAARKEAEGFPPDGSSDNPEQRPNAERCLVGDGQPPLSSFSLDSEIQIVRTRDQVVILAEYGDDVRIVPLTSQHAPRALWSRLGDSIGRWEGATLVIETVGMPDGDRVRLAPTLIVSGDATVIERLTPISDRELLYQFTVVDPKVFTAPWLGEFSWFRTKLPMYEHACHEGNYSLPNVLAGARHDEAVAKAKVADAGR
ncbi:hypothetical protein [Phenylobacterium sp.]|jgi:hypothetical protein|uniref:hypothetical protein n=1 Tax=Phenylobacterium sp. TaxID=1871053 RepID=UPI002E3351C5|nr:hypothetical protein [Phenylobacterium sp.]HEX3366692.1 hypothetical protein [Phenylobacterium sp.]